MSIISKTDSDLLPDGNQSGSAPGDRKYRPDIQGLRGLIVVLSMFYHAQLFGVSGGYAGMDVFFVISGFVMTGILLRERVKTGKTSFASFYARRIRRILPMACLVIVSVVAATYYFLGTVQGTSMLSPLTLATLIEDPPLPHYSHSGRSGPKNNSTLFIQQFLPLPQ